MRAYARCCSVVCMPYARGEVKISQSVVRRRVHFAAAFAAISESSAFGGVGAGPVSEVRRTRSIATALSASAAFTTLSAHVRACVRA